jgi:vesicle-fusing ATPase
VAVSSLDFPLTAFGPEFYLLVNDLYVFSARPLDGFPQGYIGFAERQRMWARIAVTDSVRAQIYNPFNQERKAYLGSTDIEIGFAGKSKTEEHYDQNDLGNSVREVSSSTT